MFFMMLLGAPMQQFHIMFGEYGIKQYFIL